MIENSDNNCFDLFNIYIYQQIFIIDIHIILNYIMNMHTVTLTTMFIMMMISSIWSSPIIRTNDDNNNDGNGHHQSVNKLKSDPIGEAFRRKLTELSNDDSMMDNSDNDSGTVNNRILIDRLSSTEIEEYQRTGKLPERAQTVINDFLYNSPAGRKLLNMERQLQQQHSPKPDSTPMPSILSLSSTSIDPVVSLQPIDRYEIIQDGGRPMFIPNEHEFQPPSSSSSSSNLALNHFEQPHIPPPPLATSLSGKVSTLMTTINHNNGLEDGNMISNQNIHSESMIITHKR